MTPRYFPQYWLQSRPYAKHLVAAMPAAAARGGIPAANEVLFRTVIDGALSAGVPKEALLQDGLIAREAMGAQTLAQWHLDGKRTWDYCASLVEALRHSDPGDLQLEDLLAYLPKATYFHFGPQSDWLLNERWPVEGVLVLAPAEDNLRVLLVARSAVSWTDPTATCFQMLRFKLSDTARLPFAKAVDAAIKLDIEDIENAKARMRQAPDGIDGQAAARTLSERQQASAPVYTACLRLLGCALAYAQAFPEDCRQQWQEDTPDKWVLKASSPGKEGVRARSKMDGMGFQQVVKIGADFEAADVLTRTSGGTVQAHWRKGHWRHQAHGPQFSLRKLIWIRPTRVLGTGDSPDMPSNTAVN